MTKLLLVTEGMHEDVSLSDEFKFYGESDDDGEEIDDRKDGMESNQAEEQVLTLSEVEGGSKK